MLGSQKDRPMDRPIVSKRPSFSTERTALWRLDFHPRAVFLLVLDHATHRQQPAVLCARAPQHMVQTGGAITVSKYR